MPLNKPGRSGGILPYLFLYIPVVWAALLIAQSLGNGLPELLTNLTAALQTPLKIRWTEHSLMSILACTGAYIIGICLYCTTQGRTRDGEEHGSAQWASPKQVNAMFCQKQNKLEELQAGDYDQIIIDGAPPDWREIVAVFAVKTAGTNDGVDVVTLDADRVARLKEVFWEMTSLSSAVETIDHPDSDPDDGEDDSWTETILTISITGKTVDEMREHYAFTDEQNDMLDDLLENLDLLGGAIGNLAVTEADAKELLASLPADLSAERREIIETACQLVGKVNYFWGGKSLVLGWDSRWGTTMQVTAPGSSTTGTYRPYGMDCSGYVDWVFYNATGGEYIIGHGGGASAQHSYCTAISWDEAMPGDLVFYPEDSHVGIVGGRDESGNLLIIHCASGYNNVVITGIEGFTSIGRPVYFSD